MLFVGRGLGNAVIVHCYFLLLALQLHVLLVSLLRSLSYVFLCCFEPAIIVMHYFPVHGHSADQPLSPFSGLVDVSSLDTTMAISS